LDYIVIIVKQFFIKHMDVVVLKLIILRAHNTNLAANVLDMAARILGREFESNWMHEYISPM
jgi:hypothetical protein